MIKSADKISRKLETHLDWQILQIPNEINSTGPILFLQNQVPEKSYWKKNSTWIVDVWFDIKCGCFLSDGLIFPKFWFISDRPMLKLTGFESLQRKQSRLLDNFIYTTDVGDRIWRTVDSFSLNFQELLRKLRADIHCLIKVWN